MKHCIEYLIYLVLKINRKKTYGNEEEKSSKSLLSKADIQTSDPSRL